MKSPVAVHIFSGHNGGDTRGFHYLQGSYSRKGFGKHGPLSNPYAFGYFEHIKHHPVARFSHCFLIYEDAALPEKYSGKLFGVEPLQGQVVLSDVRPFQSSYETEDLSRVVTTDDPWFRPVDIKSGPDGSVYVADLYEQRIDHSSHYAGRIDRTNGRIYRLHAAASTGKTTGERKLPALQPTDQLAATLDGPSRWQRRMATRVLADRRETSLVPDLIQQLQNQSGQSALEKLWAIAQLGGLSDELAKQTLKHDTPDVRSWTVRMLCDDHQVDPAIAKALADLAGREDYIEVRKQLAASARRLPTADALPIIHDLLKYDEDADDVHQPLMLWWALEAHAVHGKRSQHSEILATVLPDQDSWQRPLVQQHVLLRLMTRYASAGSREELLAAAAILQAAPDQTSRDLLLKGFEEAYKGRSLADIPDDMVTALAASGGGSTALKLRQGNPDAIQQAMAAVTDPKVSAEDRRQYLEIFGEIRRPEFIPVLLQVVGQTADPDPPAAALTALQAFDDLRIGQQVTAEFAKLPPQTRMVAETLLASRSVWARELLNAVDQGKIATAEISETGLRKMLMHRDDTIQQLISKHWGSVAGATTEQMQQEIERLTVLLNGGSGNPKAGKPLYMNICGRCHRLFEEGGQVGPDLTSFKRDQLDRILASVVNPSLEIREGFENHVIVTTDGRMVNGFRADNDQQVVVLRGIDGQNLIVRRDEIEEMSVSKTSIMPEGTLKTLTDQQIRDLFAYLRSSQPVNY
ncbi:MAG: c-type cytochrome [Planctomycetaceae bacterium]